MPRVLFTKQHVGYFPGASPNLDDATAKARIADGTAVEWTEASHKKLQQELAAQAGGAQMGPPGNTEGQPVINLSGEPVPTEYEPKLRKTPGPLKVIGKTEAQEQEDAELAKADKAADKGEGEEEAHPLDELGLDTRAANVLTAAGLKDMEAVQKYADENEDFTGIEGVGAATDEQIRAALKKRAKKGG